jgi:hypothetical protein
VSTLSAFDGCRSRYGRVKRQLEERWAAQGGIILRAGVVFGKDETSIAGLTSCHSSHRDRHRSMRHMTAR